MIMICNEMKLNIASFILIEHYDLQKIRIFIILLILNI